MRTIVYKNGSDYIGEYETKTLSKWKRLGRNLSQRYMYKGYRYFANQRDAVIVYDNIRWSSVDCAIRKSNGFLGIREHYCFTT